MENSPDSSSPHRKEKTASSLSSAMAAPDATAETPRKTSDLLPSGPRSMAETFHRPRIRSMRDFVTLRLSFTLLLPRTTRETKSTPENKAVFPRLREMALLLHDFVGFEDVSFLEILVVGQADPAFVAGRHFFGVILEPPEV